MPRRRLVGIFSFAPPSFMSNRQVLHCSTVVLACVVSVGSFHAPITVANGRLGLVLRSARRQAPMCQAEPEPDVSDGSTKWKKQMRIAATATAASMAMPLAAVAAGGSDAQAVLVQGMVAGAVAGAAVDLVLYPIDTIKTRLQTDSMKELNIEALPALYSGLVGSLAGHVPSSALFFAIYQTSKVYWLEPSFGQGAVAAQLLASALGNLGASTIRVPTEVVKTRLQVGI